MFLWLSGFFYYVKLFMYNRELLREGIRERQPNISFVKNEGEGKYMESIETYCGRADRQS